MCFGYIFVGILLHDNTVTDIYEIVNVNRNWKENEYMPNSVLSYLLLTALLNSGFFILL